MKDLFAVAILVLLICGGMYFEWWRCGEMFPHAQFACFVSNK